MLHGIRIIEFEGLGPAPFAGHMLAELGAEVIVVHRPEAPSLPTATPENPLDRGKRSVTLDLKSPDGPPIAMALLRSADGLIEGLRPGVMERLGLGPADVHAVHPGLVYGRMTGWGQTGPMAQQAGHDLCYLAISGALYYASPPGQPPFVPPTLLGDVGAGALYLVSGMLAGLINAQRTGSGTVVDAAIVDGASHMMGLLMSLGAHVSTQTRGTTLLDGPHWSRCYACACGGHIAVQCLEPKFYALFLTQLGLDADPLFATQFEPAHWPAQSTRLETLFASRSRDDWAAEFEGSDACVAPVLSPDEARGHPHITARRIWQGDSPAPAPRFGEEAATPLPGARPRGADTAAILAQLRSKGLLP